MLFNIFFTENGIKRDFPYFLECPPIKNSIKIKTMNISNKQCYDSVAIR